MTKILEKQDHFEDPTLPIQIYIRDPQSEFPLHSHHFDELVIILKGTAIHNIDGQPFPVKRGNVFVVSGAQEHQYTDMHGLALANILFDSNALGMANWDIRTLPGFHALFKLEPVLRNQQKFNSCLQLHEPQLQLADEQLHALQQETTLKNPGYRVMANGRFMQLAVFLSRCYSDTPAKESLNLLRLGDAIAHIETHYAEKISLDNLARKAHLSPRHFQRIFHDCLEHSPIDYLMHIRIQKAALLLRSTGHTITNIALDCGFSDSNYLARQFRKVMNQTPGQYRKKTTP